MLGPISHPNAEKLIVIKPNVTIGSRGIWVTTGSARPVERKIAPPLPARRNMATLNPSWYRRRLFRSWKKVFQSSFCGVESEADFTPAWEAEAARVDS
jgi:hypothetical protein